jgi:hypothetical protein
MHNNINRPGEQSLKTIAKSAYSITDRAQSRLYLAKMRTVRKGPGAGSSRIHDQSTVLAGKPSAPSLKQQFDGVARELFQRLDFDCGGFVSSSKIAHQKGLSEDVFYFFGGVFQKVRQVGAVTERIFLSLCDELYLHASQADLQQLLGLEDTQNVQGKGRRGRKGKAGRHVHSCTTLKHEKSVSKMDMTAKQELITPLK